MKVKVAAVQIETFDPPSRESNLEQALSRIDEAVEEWGAKAVCLSGYFLDEVPDKNTTREYLNKIAEPVPGPSTEVMGEKAREHGIYLVAGTLFEKSEDGKIYQTAPFIGPDGRLIGKARETYPHHNTPIMFLKGAGVSPGSPKYPVFDTEIGRIGIVVDFDIIRPEISRSLALKGAELVFWPLNWSARATSYFQRCALSTSVLNGYYVVAANRAGWRRQVAEIGDLQYNGGSVIIHRGEIMAQCRMATYRALENIAVATIDVAVKDRRTPLIQKEVGEILCSLLKQRLGEEKPYIR